ncbi:MAG: hypothetical protein WDN31_16370 [Hyphomicrobium sp.]
MRTAAETANALKGRLDKRTERAGKSSRELISRLALQLHLVGEGVRDLEDGAAVEVVLAIEPAFERPGEEAASIAWCRRLADMYRGWAERRRMQISEVPAGAFGGAGLPYIVVSGFGAERALGREIGLHVLEFEDDGDQMRATARVRVAAAPLEELPKQKLKAALEASLASAGGGNVVRRYRDGASPLVRDLAAGWRTGRLDAVLAGDFDLIAVTRQHG